MLQLESVLSPSKMDESVMIEYKGNELTYHKAHILMDEIEAVIKDNRCPQVIAILMERSVELVLATLSCFDSEHIFCILDINMSVEKISESLNELGSNLILTSEKQYSKIERNACVQEWNTVVLNYQEKTSAILIENNIIYGKRERRIDNPDCSHIIFTSGTTGKPKGIICSRKSTIAFIKWERSYLDLEEGVHIAQMSTPWFDPFLRDLFLPILCKGTLHIPTERECFDPKAFFSFCAQNEIDLIHIIPTLFRQLFLGERDEYSHNIKFILLAGEMLFGVDVKKYFKKYKSGSLYNLYGPSETTLAKFCHRISVKDIDSETVKVGKPIGKTFARIIDKDGNSLPKCVAGEVVIHTEDGSYGYLDNNIQNENMFSWHSSCCSFHTADRGFIDEEGDLVLLGRIDNMRKVYGQKVFPEEIEGVLLSCQGVRECRCDITNNRISAYIETDPSFDIVFVKLALSSFVKYKRPRKIMVVDHIPVNKSGKVDRNCLIGDGAILGKHTI